MREDTGMHPARDDASPPAPATRMRRIVWAVRAILRPRATSLPWGAGRVLAGAILAAGVIARALFGWRWWVVVIVLTVAGEAAIVASTLARSADREELIDELVAALAPGRQLGRRTRRALERFRVAPFPIYGLPQSWTGERFLGDWATRRDRRAGAERTTSMQLGHGERLADRGPLLLVEVDAAGRPRRGRPDLAERLAHATAASGRATGDDGGAASRSGRVGAAWPGGAAAAGPGGPLGRARAQGRAGPLGRARAQGRMRPPGRPGAQGRMRPGAQGRVGLGLEWSVWRSWWMASR
jgi:hypothetical protein